MNWNISSYAFLKINPSYFIFDHLSCLWHVWYPLLDIWIRVNTLVPLAVHMSPMTKLVGMLTHFLDGWPIPINMPAYDIHNPLWMINNPLIFDAKSNRHLWLNRWWLTNGWIYHYIIIIHDIPLGWSLLLITIWPFMTICPLMLITMIYFHDISSCSSFVLLVIIYEPLYGH